MMILSLHNSYWLSASRTSDTTQHYLVFFTSSIVAALNQYIFLLASGLMLKPILYCRDLRAQVSPSRTAQTGRHMGRLTRAEDIRTCGNKTSTGHLVL